MNLKDMKKTVWPRCVRKDYISRDCLINGIQGVESLSVLRELTAPLTVHYDFGDVLIADTGYSWLQIALNGQYFWLTAMYDGNGRFIQLYFDITNGNCFDDPDNPCFDDMYLDIVVTNGGKIQIVDQDELDDALAAGAVTKEEYEHTKKVCHELYEYLLLNKDDVIEMCGRKVDELKSLL